MTPFIASDNILNGKQVASQLRKWYIKLADEISSTYLHPLVWTEPFTRQYENNVAPDLIKTAL